MRDRLKDASLMATEFSEDSKDRGHARYTGKGNREDRQDWRWDARCGKPTQEATGNGRAVCGESGKHGSGRGGEKRIAFETTWGAKCTGKSRDERSLASRLLYERVRRFGACQRAPERGRR